MPTGGRRGRRPERPDDGRQRLLQRLAHDVGELRESLAAVHDELLGLVATEAARSLTAAEAARVAAARRDSTRLRFELERLREEFETLRGDGDGRDN